jgi:hypothetical protein
MAMLEGTTKPTIDHPRRPPGSDDLPVAFEPHLAGGITQQVSTLGLREQRTQV